MMTPWYALRVPAGREMAALDLITARGLECLVPIEHRLVRRFRVRADMSLARQHVMLPGYLFAPVQPDQWHWLRQMRFPVISPRQAGRVTYRDRERPAGWTPYDLRKGDADRVVVGVLGDPPARLPVAELAALHAMHGQTRAVPVQRGLAVGDKVLVKDGPLAGTVTTVTRVDRGHVSVLQKFLGSHRVVEIKETALEFA